MSSRVRPNTWRLPLLLLSLAAFGFLALHAVSSKGVSSDEPPHLAAGFFQWRGDRPWPNPEHPPLVKWLAALPFAVESRVIPENLSGYESRNQWQLGRSLLFRSGLPLDRLLFQSRLLTMIWSLAAALGVFWFAAALWGDRAGYFSLATFALHPLVLAHAPLVQTDMALAAAAIWAAYWAWRFEQNPRWREGLLLSAALALALAVKFSGGLVVFAVLIPVFVGTRKKVWRDPKRAVSFGAVAFFILFLGLSLPYGSLGGVSDYLHGLSNVYGNHEPGYPYFFWGQSSLTGFRTYYLLGLLLKSPVSWVLMVSLGIYLAYISDRTRALRYLLTVPLLYGLILSVSAHNIGLRHLLPALPAICVFSGALVGASARKWLRMLGLTLVLILSAETVSQHPNYLPYVNVLAGGPKEAPRYFDDSNVDWGMELKNLPASLSRHHVASFRMEYFGQDDAVYRQVTPSPMRVLDLYFPDGDYVVSAHYLARPTLIPAVRGYRYDWLGRYEPLERIGNSLYLYRIRPVESGEFEEEGGVDRMEWLRHGFAGLERLVRENPTFYPAALDLAQAHARWGNLENALRILDDLQAKVPTLAPYADLRRDIERLRRERAPNHSTRFPTPPGGK